MSDDTISETDVRIFTELTNPIKTNTDLLRKDMSSSSSQSIPEKIVEERESDRKKQENGHAFSDHMRTVSAPPSVHHLPMVTDYDSRKEGEYLEKQRILLDMERLKGEGVVLSKKWTIDDRIEDMTFEMRRHAMHAQEVQNVGMMKDAMRMACTGIELFSSRWGFLDLDGWASEVCSDMQKYDAALVRIYRKYWRTSSTQSPEVQLAFGLISSLLMHHFKRKFSTRVFPHAPSHSPGGGKASDPFSSMMGGISGGLGGLGGLGGGRGRGKDGYDSDEGSEEAPP